MADQNTKRIGQCYAATRVVEDSDEHDLLSSSVIRGEVEAATDDGRRKGVNQVQPSKEAGAFFLFPEGEHWQRFENQRAIQNHVSMCTRDNE